MLNTAVLILMQSLSFFFSKTKMVKELFVYSSLKREIKFQSTNIYETPTLGKAFCQILRG